MIAYIISKFYMGRWTDRDSSLVYETRERAERDIDLIRYSANAGRPVKVVQINIE